MESLSHYRKRLKETLSSERYYHSICVERQAVYLAEYFQVDTQKAATAGLLHDVCKEWDYDRHLQYLKSRDILVDIQTLQNPAVLHGITGSVYLKEEWGIDDPEILGAVRWHTTGKADMSRLEAIVFISDFTSADRNYPDVGYIRSLLPKDTIRAIVEGFAFGLNTALKNRSALIPDAVSGYNYYLTKLKEGERERGQKIYYDV